MVVANGLTVHGCISDSGGSAMNKRLSNVDNASMSSNFLYDNVLPFQVNKVNLAIRGLHVYITLSNKPLCYFDSYQVISKCPVFDVKFLYQRVQIFSDCNMLQRIHPKNARRTTIALWVVTSFKLELCSLFTSLVGPRSGSSRNKILSDNDTMLYYTWKYHKFLNNL